MYVWQQEWRNPVYTRRIDSSALVVKSFIAPILIYKFCLYLSVSWFIIKLLKKERNKQPRSMQSRTYRFNTQFSLHRFIINNRIAEVYVEVHDSVCEGVDPQLYSGKHKIVVIKKLDFLFWFSLFWVVNLVQSFKVLKVYQKLSFLTLLSFCTSHFLKPAFKPHFWWQNTFKGHLVVGEP